MLSNVFSRALLRQGRYQKCLFAFDRKEGIACETGDQLNTFADPYANHLHVLLLPKRVAKLTGHLKSVDLTAQELSGPEPQRGGGCYEDPLDIVGRTGLVSENGRLPRLDRARRRQSTALQRESESHAWTVKMHPPTELHHAHGCYATEGRGLGRSMRSIGAAMLSLLTKITRSVTSWPFGIAVVMSPSTIGQSLAVGDRSRCCCCCGVPTIHGIQSGRILQSLMKPWRFNP